MPCNGNVKVIKGYNTCIPFKQEVNGLKDWVIYLKEDFDQEKLVTQSIDASLRKKILEE